MPTPRSRPTNKPRAPLRLALVLLGVVGVSASAISSASPRLRLMSTEMFCCWENKLWYCTWAAYRAAISVCWSLGRAPTSPLGALTPVAGAAGDVVPALGAVGVAVAVALGLGPPS